MLKPARDAMFLEDVGIERLPYVLMLAAVVGGIAAALFAKLTQTQRIDRLILASYTVLALALLGFRLLLESKFAWAFYAFYVWVALYGLIAVALLWLYAGVSIHPQQAARTFGFIGSGGIAGAVLGGLFTSIVARPLGTENLLIVSSGLVFGALVLLRRVPIKTRDKRRSKQSNVSGFQAIKSSPLLLRLAAITFCTAMISVFVDVQFNDMVARNFDTRDEKTAFFGQFMAAMSAVAIVLQLAATPRLLQRAGAVFTFGLLPIGLAIGSAAILVLPGLTTAMLLKTSDGALRYSVHKAASETLFLPLPSEVKQRTKLILDAAVDALASGLGAGVVYVLRRGAGLEFVQLAWVSIALVLPWLMMTLTLRRPYLEVFRRAIERREIDLGVLGSELNEASSVRQLVSSLEQSDQRQLAYTLDLLAGAKDPSIGGRLLPLLAHESAEIRLRALRVVSRLGRPAVLDPIERLLNDPDPDVREEAADFVLSRDRKRLEELLRDDRAEVWIAALVWIGRNGTPEDRAAVPPEKIARLFAASEGADTEIDRRWAAKALSAIGDPELSARLLTLAQEGPPELVEEVISAAARSGEIQTLQWLLERLGDPRHRSAARNAILAIGEPAVEPLIKALAGDATPLVIRRHIPRVLAHLPAQSSVDALFAEIDRADPSSRLMLFRAMTRLRRDHPELKFDRKKVRLLVKREVDVASELRAARAAFTSARRSEAVDLLTRALDEREREALERMFRLVALISPADDTLAMFESLTTERAPLEKNRIKTLQHLLGGELRRLVWPVIDPDHKIELDPERSIRRLIEGDDAWLRACAMFALNDVELSADPKPFLHRGKEDPDPRVREAAEAALLRGAATC